jgi:hypothetical protein
MGWNGTHHLIVWNDTVNGALDVKGLRLDAAGQPVDVAPFAITNAPCDQTAGAIASDGKDFFVVFADGRNQSTCSSSSEFDIYGARVSGAGQVLDPNGQAIEVTPIANRKSSVLPSVAYSPSAQRYLVTWTVGVTGDQNIRGAEVERSGTVRAPGSYDIAASTDIERASGVFALDKSRMLVTYSRLDMHAPFGSTRARARVIDLDGSKGTTPDAGAPQPDAGGNPDAGGSGGPVEAGDDAGAVEPGNDGSSGASCGCRAAPMETPIPSYAWLVVGVAMFAARRKAIRRPRETEISGGRAACASRRCSDRDPRPSGSSRTAG